MSGMVEGYVRVQLIINDLPAAVCIPFRNVIPDSKAIAELTAEAYKKLLESLQDKSYGIQRF